MTQKYIWNEESAAFGTIPPLPFGVAMLGPVIYTFGNQEQKDWVLPGILSGEDVVVSGLFPSRVPGF